MVDKVRDWAARIANHEFKLYGATTKYANALDNGTQNDANIWRSRAAEHAAILTARYAVVERHESVPAPATGKRRTRALDLGVS